VAEETPTPSGPVTVPADLDGERLDRVVAALTSLTRSRVQQLIRDGRVMVGDGEVVRPSHPVSAGETIQIDLPPPPPTTLVPEDIPLDVRHEDEHLLVLVKPAGLVVHPGAGVDSGTLVHALLHRLGPMPGVGGADRPGIVHRLDRETSGLMVVAKTPPAYLGLVDAIKRREVTRRYRALVWGEPPPEFVIDAPIGRHPRDRVRMAVVSGGRPATTEARVLTWFDFVSELDLSLVSGRTHQIRVRLAHRGFPVFGDPVYDGRDRQLRRLSHEERVLAKRLLATLPRQALHAWQLAFAHPITRKSLRFEAEVPDDLAHVRSSLGTGRTPTRGT